MIVCGAVGSSVIQRYIWYNDYPQTWQTAQTKCQSEGKELLTVVTESENDNVHMDLYYAWIGLRRKQQLLGAYWYWFGTSDWVSYLLFTQNGPYVNGECALAIYNNDKIARDTCETGHFFFCHYWEDSQRKYKFYPERKSWDDAFQFCQDNNQYLAFINDWNNKPSDEMRNFPVWTGLYHDGESWSWSDGEYSDYWKWAPDFDPGSSSGSGLCGSVWSQNKSMSVHSCSEAFPFLCYTHNLVLVKENLTWEEALEQCKSLQAQSPYQGHQLLSVEPSELLYANSKAIDAQTDKVWLGLRFLGGFWFWSNGQTVSLPGLPSCPESTLGCGALVLDRTSNGSEPQPTVEPSDCSERLNLLCYWF
ncbi:hypothetical protein NQD34_009078 [Periophthalmus magnuspinnatus]|nr:hypothetical protein NQD34_009078 [Periophthalmus magnuspinnatus]